MFIENKVFVITGAGSGLGAAVARMAVAAGAKAVLVDLNETAGHALSDELGIATTFVKADVTSAEQGAAAVQTARPPSRCCAGCRCASTLASLSPSWANRARANPPS